MEQLKDRPHIRILDMDVREIEVIPDERRFAVRGYDEY